MTDSYGRVPLEEACNDIRTRFWATQGLESGVKEQTEEVLNAISEVAASLRCLASIAIVPFGSRFKGYARLDSDLDLAIIHYDERVSSFQATSALDEAVAKRLGVNPSEPSLPNKIDATPTVSLIDYGYVTSFSPGYLPLALAAATFEGERATEIRNVVLEEWSRKSEMHLDYAEGAYTGFFIEPRIGCDGVAFRYSGIASAPGLSDPSFEEIETSFYEAYRQRLHDLGGDILGKIIQQIN